MTLPVRNELLLNAQRLPSSQSLLLLLMVHPEVPCVGSGVPSSLPSLLGTQSQQSSIRAHGCWALSAALVCLPRSSFTLCHITRKPGSLQAGCWMDEFGLCVHTLAEVFPWMESFSLRSAPRMDFLFQLLLTVIHGSQSPPPSPLFKRNTKKLHGKEFIAPNQLVGH